MPDDPLAEQEKRIKSEIKGVEAQISGVQRELLDLDFRLQALHVAHHSLARFKDIKADLEDELHSRSSPLQIELSRVATHKRWLGEYQELLGNFAALLSIVLEQVEAEGASLNQAIGDVNAMLEESGSSDRLPYPGYEAIEPPQIFRLESDELGNRWTLQPGEVGRQYVFKIGDSLKMWDKKREQWLPAEVVLRNQGTSTNG